MLDFVPDLDTVLHDNDSIVITPNGISGEAPQAKPTVIDPRCLYPLQGFYAASGISETRVLEAKRMGIPFPTIEAGRRKFIRGVDAIEFIEQLGKATVA